jgi:hypothetical protein
VTVDFGVRRFVAGRDNVLRRLQGQEREKVRRSSKEI